MKDNLYIKCPKCGREYTINEIFMDEDFLGTQHHIIKDEEGKIIGFDGEEPLFEEEFECDECNTKMHLKANVTIKVDSVQVEDDDEFTVKLEDK